MPKPIALDKPCEVCGKNEWWDNSATKKSPKAPDFACANKECAGKDGYKVGRWLPKGNAKAAPIATGGPAPQGGRITPDDTTPDEQGKAVFTYEALAFTYGKLLGAVVKSFETNKVPLDPSALQAAVATLLIQGKDQHIPLLHPRKPTPVAPFEQNTAPAKPKKEIPQGDAFEDFERVDEEQPWP